uniref:Putative secreted protein n=1 Tax=Ixodes ricinus TaxID=34613 RepID=A0A6B0U6L9_IXORI
MMAPARKRWSGVSVLLSIACFVVLEEAIWYFVQACHVGCWEDCIPGDGFFGTSSSGLCSFHFAKMPRDVGLQVREGHFF